MAAPTNTAQCLNLKGNLFLPKPSYDQCPATLTYLSPSQGVTPLHKRHAQLLSKS